ncbi:MAG: DIP1984 family protein [Planctomycetota bacterium]
MKLAEALLLRADLQKKLASLKERIAQNAVVQQGDKPHEDPNKLLSEAAGVLDQLEKLLFQINEANLQHKLKDGRPLTKALAQRDALAMRHGVLEAAIAGAKKPPDRYGLKEIKWVAKVDVKKLQKQADDLSKQLRVLNGMVQEANWKIEL